MGALLNRRRLMGDSADEIIMTSTSNPEVMAICYTQGWAAHSDYMTKKEARKVKSVGTIFKGTEIVSFNEFQYFTNVTSLSNDAFMDCTSLTEISLPNSVDSIPNRCFYRDTELLSINLENVTRLNALCFYNCQKLNNVDTSNVTYMESAFRGCTSLTSVDISNCSTLGNEVFRDCTSLTWIDVSGIVSITGSGLFRGSKLTGDFVFDSFTGTTIPASIFDNVETITSVSFPNSDYTSIGDRAFAFCGLQSFVIREGCTTLNNHSFSGGNWRYIDLPSTLTTWNGFALWSNNNQEVIICRATTPPTVGNTTGSQKSFDSIPATCKLYVPQASISSYEATAGWDKFTGRYLPIEGSWYETHRSLCPYDAEIEYLESSGTQYIDTGIIPGNTYGYEVKFYINNMSAETAQLGVWHAWGNSMWGHDCKYINNKILCVFGGKNNEYLGKLSQDIHTIKMFNGNFYFDGVLTKQTAGGTFTCTGNATMFGIRVVSSSSVNYKNPQKIYSCKIFKDTESNLVRDFIPVRVGTTGYMYDKVSGELFGNAGTGDFILGNDL